MHVLEGHSVAGFALKYLHRKQKGQATQLTQRCTDFFLPKEPAGKGYNLKERYSCSLGFD